MLLFNQILLIQGSEFRVSDFRIQKQSAQMYSKVISNANRKAVEEVSVGVGQVLQSAVVMRENNNRSIASGKGCVTFEREKIFEGLLFAKDNGEV